jgi:predicted phosphodiesterase
VTTTLAHVSDLHLGRDARTDEGAARTVDALRHAGVDAVLVTGDVTDRGRWSELATFERLFAPLGDRVLVVPGNHDRLGDDAGAGLMTGPRVQAASRRGLHVVRVDSTAPHNRALLASHGELSAADIAAVESAIDAAPPGSLVALMLHHHLLPLPEDRLSERLATFLGWPNAAELALGGRLLERLRGRCDLVAHGHRHATSELVLDASSGRPLHVMNAGSTPELGRVRILTHAAGRILAEEWLDVSGGRTRRGDRDRVGVPMDRRAQAAA